MQAPGKLFTLTKFLKNPSVNQANIVFQCFFFVLKTLSCTTGKSGSLLRWFGSNFRLTTRVYYTQVID